MPEWLYEAGIGEARAALVEHGAVVEARIEPESTGARAGAIVPARLTTPIIARRRGIVTLETGEEALLEPIPAGATEGAALLVEVLREAIPEEGRVKLAKARAAPPGALPSAGRDLLARITATGLLVTSLAAHEPDRLEAAGWSEILEQAATGDVSFAGGALRISPTPAMTVIDVDGTLPPAELAVAGGRAAGEAIRRFGIAGSIGIDLPTLAERADRQAAAAALDAALPPPFERTAVNGFGFVQIVRRRARASLIELMRFDRTGAQARALLRRAERTPGAGPIAIRARPTVAGYLADRRDWLAALERRVGGAVSVESADTAGEVSRAHPG